MHEIINEKFEVGEIYKGQINGALLQVAKVHCVPIRYHDVIIYGMVKSVPYKWANKIQFTDLKTGYKHETDLEWAKRLLLKKNI